MSEELVKSNENVCNVLEQHLELVNNKIEEVIADDNKKYTKEDIPHGEFCYNFCKGDCPFWHKIAVFPEWRVKGRELELYTGMDSDTYVFVCSYSQTVSNIYDSLFWDKIKHCGVNVDLAE